MAEREVKVKVKLIGEQVGIDPGSKLDELTKRAAHNNKELQGSYKALTREEVDQAVATEKLTGKKSKLLEAFKNLRNDVPGVGMILNALRNPLTAIGAAFMAAKSAVDAYKASMDRAAERQAAITGIIERQDFDQIARDSAASTREWRDSLQELETTAKASMEAIEKLRTMAEGAAGIKQKVATARAQAEIAQINQQVESGAMTKEEGARRIAAINARAAREGQAARRESTVSQVKVIDEQMAALEARRAGLLQSAPTEQEVTSLQGRVKQASDIAVERKKQADEARADYGPRIRDAEAGVASTKSTFAGKLMNAVTLGLYGFDERDKLRALQGWLAPFEEDERLATSTERSEKEALEAALAKRGAIGSEVQGINQTLTGLRGRRESLLVTQGLADSEAGALRPFTQRLDAVTIQNAQSQDAARAAQIQAEANRNGSSFLSGLEGAAGEWNRTMERAAAIMKNSSDAARAARLNDQ